MFLAIPPLIGVIRLIPRIGSWFINLTWVRWFTGRPAPLHQDPSTLLPTNGHDHSNGTCCCGSTLRSDSTYVPNTGNTDTTFGSKPSNDASSWNTSGRPSYNQGKTGTTSDSIGMTTYPPGLPYVNTASPAAVPNTYSAYKAHQQSVDDQGYVVASPVDQTRYTSVRPH
jgi:hypothetical protein